MRCFPVLTGTLFEIKKAKTLIELLPKTILVTESQ